MNRTPIAFALAATVGALTFAAWAGVTTNVWINAEGGDAADAANWQDGALPTSTSVADFSPLASGKTVHNWQPDDHGKNNTYDAAGLLFSGGAGDTWTHEKGYVNAYPAELGYTPLCVRGGSLTWDTGITPKNGSVVRKIGDGTLRPKLFAVGETTSATLEVAEGKVIPEYFLALWTTHVRVLSGGTFELRPGESNTYIGSFETETGDRLDLIGQSLSLGGNGDGVLSDAVGGAGRVQSVAGANLVVRHPSPDITYVAREGNLRFDRQGVERNGLIGCWTFEDAANPGHDSGMLGNDLIASNGVSVVEDPVRGKVAYFNGANGAALYGRGTNGAIDKLPSGSHAYTFAYWLKINPQDTHWSGALFYWGALPVSGGHSVLNRLGGGDGIAQNVIGHSGSCSWPTITGLYEGKWRHITVAFDGKQRFSTYTNGVLQCHWDWKDNTTDLLAANFSIGRPWSTAATWLKGYLDDAMFFNRALSAAEIATLCEDVPDVERPTDLPAGIQLETTDNGEIYLAGTQAVATVGGNSVRGGVRMNRPGELTLTGDVEGGKADYTADIAGPVDVVKDGADTTVTLRGPITTTGKVRVKAGTLALAREGTDNAGLFARYDFEDAADLGRDSSGKERNLSSNNGVTQVEDAARGKVAKFTAQSKQTLSGAFQTYEMCGNSDYTFSVWAKASDSCPDAGSFVSFGTSGGDFQQVQFRYQSIGNRTLVLAHWGGALDFTGISAPNDPKAWHHYVAVHKGQDFYVYCDGVQKTKRTSATALKFQTEKKVYVGSHFAANDARFFDGLIDDVRIYNVGLDADNVARLYSGLEPQLEGLLVEEPADTLPKPVLHYAFEDAANLGKDSSATGCDLVAGGSGTLSQGDSILPGKALQFDMGNLSYLQDGGTIPSVIPQGGSPFTVSFWVQTTERDVSSGVTFPTFVSWGDPEQKKIGYMFAYRFEAPWRYRCYVSGNVTVDGDSERAVLGLRTGSDVCRWHHVATTYDKGVGVRTYIDGRKIPKLGREGGFTTTNSATRFFLGIKPTDMNWRFAGKLDEVKIYDVALDESQIRLAIRAEMNPGSAVLPKHAEVTVDAGATLETRGGVNEVASLGGAGAVNIAASSRFAAADYGGFSGTVSGKGQLVCNGAAVPSGATVESDVVVADLELRMADAGSETPLLTTSGKVRVAASGVCTITGWERLPQLGGKTWAIAKGAEVVAPTDFAGWTLDPAPKHGYRFFVRDNTLCLRIESVGTMILVR